MRSPDMLSLPIGVKPTPAEAIEHRRTIAAAGFGPAQPRSRELQHALDEIGRIFGDHDHAKSD